MILKRLGFRFYALDTTVEKAKYKVEVEDYLVLNKDGSSREAPRGFVGLFMVCEAPRNENSRMFGPLRDFLTGYP